MKNHPHYSEAANHTFSARQALFAIIELLEIQGPTDDADFSILLEDLQTVTNHFTDWAVKRNAEATQEWLVAQGVNDAIHGR